MESAVGDAVLRFALATLAMKRSVTPHAFQRSDWQSSHPHVSARDDAVMPPLHTSAMCAQTAPVETALLAALDECLQRSHDTLSGRNTHDGEETIAQRVVGLLRGVLSDLEQRASLVEMLVQALLSCEDGEEDSLLIQSVSRGTAPACR